MLRGMAAGNCTVSRMAVMLNTLGVPGPRGGQWHPVMVSRVISRLPDFEVETSVIRELLAAEKIEKASPQFVAKGITNPGSPT